MRDSIFRQVIYKSNILTAIVQVKSNEFLFKAIFNKRFPAREHMHL